MSASSQSANVNVCAYLNDQSHRDLVQDICGAAGWSVQHLISLDAQQPDSAVQSPDVVFIDTATNLAAFREFYGQEALFIFVGAPAQAGDLPYLSSTEVEVCVTEVTTYLNEHRFRRQFFNASDAEPITKLPRHPELLALMENYVGSAMGLIVVQIDHAQHLYTNMDPVSRTDLLASFSDHLRQMMPEQAELGIFDAACFSIWIPQSSPVELERHAIALTLTGKAPMAFKSGELHFTLSVGFAHRERLTDPNTLWEEVWEAKEQARAAGGNTSQEAIGLTNTAVEARIPDALATDEFSLVLQPQYTIDGTELTGVESLLRWQGLEIGGLAPDHFIPVAERSGQMARVGDWVLERSSCEAATWLENLTHSINLSVNISPQQFINDAIKDQIDRLVQDQWLNPGILEIELTHTNLLQVVDQHRKTLYGLRDMGVRIAIDNMGHGVVDTQKLLRCPADTLKIDRRLIAQMHSSAAALSLVEHICRLGTRFNLRVIAVGVETEEQRSQLEQLGCSEGQGFLFSPPVPMEQFQSYLQEEQQKKFA